MQYKHVAVTTFCALATTLSYGQEEKGPSSNAIYLDQVTVIADQVDGSTISESKLNQDQIETQQSATVQELIDTLPGTTLVGSPRTGGQTINIRGFGNYSTEHVQMFIDGAPKSFEKYQQGSLFIEPDLLKAVSVSKGAHSAQQGNGGFGGAVKMETKSANDMLKPGQSVGGRIKTGFQTNNNMELYSASLYAGGEDNPGNILINLTKRRADDLKLPDGTRYNYSGLDANAGLLKLGYDFDNGHSISLAHMENHDASRAPWAARRGVFKLSDWDIKKENGNYDLALYKKTVWRETEDKNTIFKHKYSSPSQDWLNTELTLSYTETTQHDTRPEEAKRMSMTNMGNESWTDYNNTFFELKNSQELYFGNTLHQLSYGVQYQIAKVKALIDATNYSTYKNNPDYNFGYLEPSFFPSGTQKTASLFVEDEIIWNQWTITPALRFDHIRNQGKPNRARKYNNPALGHDYSDQHYSGFSPKLGLYYQWSPTLALFGNLSYAFKAPTIDEQYSVSTGNASATSRSLDPEEVTTAELGFVKNMSGLLTQDDNLLVRTTLFRSEVKHNINIRMGDYYTRDEQGHSLPGQEHYVNQKGYYIQGIELEMFYDAPRMMASFNLSAMDSKMNGTPRDPNGPDVPVLDVPPPEANMMLGYKFNEAHINTGWKGKYVHKKDRTARDIDNNPMVINYAYLGETSSYMLHGLFLEWKPEGELKDLEVRAELDNLFNKEYTPYLQAGVPGAGRNLKVSVSMSW